MESLLFAPLPRRRLRPTSVAGSAVAHIAFVLLLAALSRYAAPPEDERIDWSRYLVEPIRFHLAQPISLPPAPSRALTAHVRFPATRQSRPGPAILQPAYRPQLPPPPSAIPPMAFWSPVPPRLPQPDVITPGRIAPAVPPQLAARPVLAPPNREATIGDTSISLPPAPALNVPALAVTNRGTMPIQLSDARESRPAVFEMSAGQPAQVLAFADRPMAARDVEIPTGLQNVPGVGRATGSGGGSPVSSALHADSAMPVPPPPAARAVGAPEATRIEHPATGSFDVVIVQSGTRDDLPPLGMRLTGAPVYTVYLPVGDRQEWLLEYCAPSAAKPAASTYEVNIEDEGSITPPFPISTAIPTRILGERFASQIVFHGLLTANGLIQDFRTSMAPNAIVQSILSLMAEWRFRPAMRNRKPIDVEVLLIIPPRV
jgi:hypothetical protein